MQRLFGSRFAGPLSHAIGQLADVRVPARVLRPVIKAYSLALGVELDGVIEPSGGFESFGDFFVRRLRSEMRPLCQDRGALICPSDGRLVGFGPIAGDGTERFTIKGQEYELGLLLGAWGPCADDGCIADLDGDVAVGGGDLGVLLGNWSTEP